jgi:hypothetical protein
MVRAMDDNVSNILKLLKGYVRIDSRRLPEQAYLENGSDEESEARTALARLLSSDDLLNDEIRASLAELFSPNPYFFERKITFQFRSRGARENFYANATIMKELWIKVKLRGSTLSKAIDELEEKYQLDRSVVTDLWSKRNKGYEKALGCLCRLKYGI